MPIVVFDLDNTLVHSRIDFLGIRTAVIERLVQVGALHQAPADPRSRAIPEWLDLAAAHDPHLAAELWLLVDRFEREGMLHGTVEADTRACLDRLRDAGLRLAVLTNNSLGSADAALERFDLRATVRPGAGARGGDGAQARRRRVWRKPTGTSAVARPTSSATRTSTGSPPQRAAVGARFIAFRANAAELAARGVRPWAAIQALVQLPRLLGV